MKRASGSKLLGSIILISILVAQLLTISFAETPQPYYPGLRLYAFKYRRGTYEEALWANSTEEFFRYANPGVENLAPHQLMKVPVPNIALMRPPEGTSDVWYPHEVSEGAIVPTEEMRERAEKEYPVMCRLLSLVHSHLYSEVVPHEVSGSIEDYMMHMPSTGEDIAFYLYFLDYVPLFVKEGDLYANYCLAKAAMEPPTLSNYVSVFRDGERLVVYPTLSPLGTGIDAVLSFIGYERYVKGSPDPIRDAVRDLMGSLPDSVAEDPFKWLKLNLYAYTYLPLFYERKYASRIEYSLPADDAMILTLVPEEIFINARGDDFDAVAYDPVTRRLTTDPFMYPRADSYAYYAPIDIIYEGRVEEAYHQSVPARTYRITVWVEGPALIASARPSPDLSLFLPPGMEYEYVDVTHWYAYNVIAVNTSLMRLGGAVSDFVEEMNNTFVIPSNLSSIKPPGSGSNLETFYWILPDMRRYGKIYSFTYSTTSPEDTARSIRDATIMLIPDPLQGAGEDSRIRLHILIEEGSRSWRKVVTISLKKPLFEFTSYADRYGYSDEADFHIWIKPVNETRMEEEVYGKISITRSGYARMDWYLKGIIFGAKMYSITHEETIKEEVQVIGYRKDYIWITPQDYSEPVLEDTITHHLFYIYETLNNAEYLLPEWMLDRYRGQLYYQPLTLKREVNVSSTYTVILGGASPFPNWGAIPYFIPNLPSPLLFPSYTPTASAILNFTHYPYFFPLPDEMISPIGDFMFYYGRRFGDYLGKAQYYIMTPDLLDPRNYEQSGNYIRELGFGLIFTDAPVSFDVLNEPMYDLLKEASHHTGEVRAHILTAPLMIDHTSVRSEVAVGPIPKYVYTYGDESIDHMINGDTIWTRARTWVEYEDVVGYLNIYTALEAGDPYPKLGVAVVTQAPTIREYNLTLPYTVGRFTPVRVHLSDYGWTLGNATYVDWPPGLTWMRLPIEGWAYGIGMPGMIHIDGNLHYPYNYGIYFIAPNFYLTRIPDIFFGRHNPLLSYVEEGEGGLVGVPYCLTESTCFVPISQASPNPWLPLGDGAQTIPVFYQVAMKMGRGPGRGPRVSIRTLPDHVMVPGDEVTVYITVDTGEPIGSDTVTARLYLNLPEGVANPFAEGFPIDVTLQKGSLSTYDTTYTGTVKLHIKSPDELANENITYSGLLTVSLVAKWGNYFDVDSVEMFLGEGLVIRLIDMGLRFAVPDPSTGYPVADPGPYQAWWDLMTRRTVPRFLERAYVVFSNETGEWVVELGPEDIGFSSGRFRVVARDLSPGEYRVRLILDIRYIYPSRAWDFYDPTEYQNPIYTINAFTEYGWLERANVTLDLGHLRYDPAEPEAVTIAYPLTDTAWALAVLKNIGYGWRAYKPLYPSMLMYTLPSFGGPAVIPGEWAHLLDTGIPEGAEEIKEIAEMIGGGEELLDALSYARNPGKWVCQEIGVSGVCSNQYPAFYSEEGTRLYEELLSLLESGVTPMRVGEPLTNTSSYYIYQAIDLIRLLTNEMPVRVNAWAISAGHHLTLAAVAASESYGPQSTAMPLIALNYIRNLFEDSSDFAGAVTALVPITADAPAFSGMIARDTALTANRYLATAFGGNEEVMKFFSILGDSIAIWAWMSRGNEGLRIRIGTVIYERAAMYLYFRILNQTLATLTDTLNEREGIIPAFSGYYRTVTSLKLNKLGTVKADKELFKAVGMWGIEWPEGTEAVLESHDAVASLGISMEDPYTSLTAEGIHIAPYPEITAGSTDLYGMATLNKLAGFSTSTSVGGKGVIRWWGDPLFEAATSSRTSIILPAQAIALGAAGYRLSSDAAASLILSAASLSEIVVAQSSGYYAEMGGEEVYNYSVTSFFDEVSDALDTLSWGSLMFGLYRNYYGSTETLINVTRALLNSSPRHLYISGVLDWVEQNMPREDEAGVAALAASSGLVLDVPAGYGERPITTAVKVYSKLAKLSTLSRAYLVSIGEAVTDPENFLTGEYLSEAAKYYVAASVLTSVADTYLAEYGRWVEVMESGGGAEPRYVEALIMAATSLYVRAILYELQAMDFLWSAGAPIPETPLDEIISAPYAVVNEYVYPSLWPVAPAYIKPGGTIFTYIKLPINASVTFISPGEEGGCGSVIDFGPGGATYSSCNYLTDAVGSEHDFNGTMTWSGEGIDKPVNLVAYVRLGDSRGYAVAMTVSWELILTTEPKMAGGEGSHAVAYLKHFVGQGISAEPVEPVISVDDDALVVQANITVSGSELKDFVLGIYLDLDHAYSLIPDGHVLDLGNIEVDASGAEYRGMCVVREISGVPVSLYTLLNIREAGNASIKLVIPVVAVGGVRASTVTYSPGGLTTVNYGGAQVLINSTGPATIETRGSGNLVKLSLTGSSADIMIPSSLGVPTSIIIGGIEVPLEAEEVIINGTLYYIIRASTGEITIKLGEAGGGTTTTTTTHTTTTTITVTTTTTTAATTSQTTIPTTTTTTTTAATTTTQAPGVGEGPPAGVPTEYVVIGVTAVAAAGAAAFIIRRKKRSGT